MKWRCCLLTSAALLGAVFVLAGTAYGQGDKGVDIDPQRTEAALKKACEWLKTRQQADGRWKSKENLLDDPYPEGITALCLYALLKGGEERGSECIKKGLSYLKARPLKTVYGVSTLILALTALYAPPPPGKGIEEEEKKSPEDIDTSVFEPYEKKLKDSFKKAPKTIQSWLKKAVAWLLKQQNRNVWRYPGNQPGGKTGGDAPMEDASNTQYAMLALYCARRAGISVSKNVFAKAAGYFLASQQPDGPAVPLFPVLAADFDITKLKELEKNRSKQMKQAAETNRKLARDAKKAGKELPELRSPSSSVPAVDPYEKYGSEQAKMKARGWAYLSGNIGRITGDMKEEMLKVTGSMTTSGITALLICKDQLGSSLKGKTKARLNQAVRDGIAWLVHNWSVRSNPECPGWHLYYLCGLERVGALSLCSRLGEHNWYAEGAQHLLSSQKGDGSWAGEERKVNWSRITLGYCEEVSTSFAILFLKRATVPVVVGLHAP